MSLYVPVRGLPNAVCIQLDSLPDDVIQIVDVLRAEAAPLALWFQLAVEYYKRGMNMQFVNILEEGTREEIETHYKHCKSERICILSALGVFHTRSAMKMTDKDKRQKFFELATMYFKKADGIDIHESHQWLGKGLMYLAIGDLVRADLQFSSILEKHPVSKHPSSIAALLGKGCINYLKKDYKASLTNYTLALKSNPNCSAYVRLGIALCAIQLGDVRLAKLSLQRVLSLDPSNSEALVALAVLSCSIGSEPLDTTIAYLENAYLVNPNNAMALSMIADHLFYQGDHQAVFELAARSSELTTSSTLKSRNDYLIARSYHVQSEFVQARFHYLSSVENDSTNMLSLLGLGQMHLKEDDYLSAKQCFDSVHVKHPDEFDCLRLLGITCARLGQLEDAKRYLTRARELFPKNVSVMVELAQVLLDSPYPDRAAAKAVLIEVATQLKAKKRASEIPIQLLNNIGVIALSLGQIDEAEDWLVQCESEQNPTVSYNKALLLEAKGSLNEATDLYLKILESYPEYHECNIRLAILAFSRKDNDESFHRLNTILDRSPSHIVALTQLGRMHAKLGKTHEAEKIFSKVLNIEKYDPYCRISLGNLHLMRALHLKKQPEQMAQALRKASVFYQSVLSRDPHNMYAANGIGAYLAYRRMNDKARQIFNDVRESSSFIPAAWINLAHLSVIDGSFDTAIKLYETCLKKNPDSDIQLLLFLARALFLKGDMKNAKRALQNAIRMEPSHLLWYNLALACEDFSITVLQKPKNARTVYEVRAAFADIVNAAHIFSELAAVAEGLIKEKAKSHAQFCQDNISLAEKHLAHAENADLKAHEARKQLEASLASAACAEKLKHDQKRQEEEEREKRTREVLEQDRLRLQRIQEQQMLKMRKREQMQSDSDGEEEVERRTKRSKKQRTSEVAAEQSTMDIDENANEQNSNENGHNGIST